MPRALGSVDPGHQRLLSTGNPEVDQVLGGGLRPGSVTLLAGPPGIGKSTLALQVLGAVANGAPALLASAEEALAQVRRRADRLGPLSPGLLVIQSPTSDQIASAVADCHPAVVVVDSAQSVTSQGVGGAPGSLPQVGALLGELTALAAQGDLAVVVVGQVTKDGALAGPRRLEHLVDTVLWLEGDRHGPLRFLRATKHRHGPTGRLGVLEMHRDGLRPALDPSRLLVGQRRPVPGSVVVPVMGGDRPLLVELQALVAPRGGRGRHLVQGLNPGRVAQLLATVDRVAGTALCSSEVHVATVGGVRTDEPAADLGLALAVVSAATGMAVPADLVILGEVGLTGALRAAPGTGRRLADAARLGFTRALGPSMEPAPETPGLKRIETLAEALETLDFLVPGEPVASPRAAGGHLSGPRPPRHRSTPALVALQRGGSRPGAKGPPEDEPGGGTIRGWPTRATSR